MNFTNTYLSVSDGYTDALIDYILDIKPYHTKLSEISEMYDEFVDTFTVSFKEDLKIVAFLGADLNSNNAASNTRHTSSWQKNIISNGSAASLDVPVTTAYKFFSQLGESIFTVGDVSNTSQAQYDFPHIGDDVVSFSPVLCENDSVAQVKVNNIGQQEGYDYFLSRGAFSFTTDGQQKWEYLNIPNNPINSLPVIGKQNGQPSFSPVSQSLFSVLNIQSTLLYEWTLHFYFENLSNSLFLTVTNSDGNTYNTINFGTLDTLVHQFSFNTDISLSLQLSAEGLTNVSQIDSYVTLTPQNKIVVSPGNSETWTIIKTNPTNVLSKAIFTPVNNNQANTPFLQINTKILERSTNTSTWEVVFINSTDYNVLLNGSNYSNGSISNHKSYSDSNIDFTIYSNGYTYSPGDSFNFITGAFTGNYLVYGSQSKWGNTSTLPVAMPGQWFNNGKIAFKLSKLDYNVNILKYKCVTSVDGTKNSWIDKNISSTIPFAVNDINNSAYLTDSDEIINYTTDGNIWSNSYPTPTSEITILDNNIIKTSLDGITWNQYVTPLYLKLNGFADFNNFPSYIESPHLIILNSANDVISNLKGLFNNSNDITLSNITIYKIVNNSKVQVTTPLRYSTINNGTLTFFDNTDPNNILYDFNVGDEIIVTYNSYSGKIVVGDNGQIYKFLNNTFVALNTQISNNINSIASSGSSVVICGDNGTLYVSVDCNLWQEIQLSNLVIPTIQQNINFNDVIYIGQSTYILVGNNDTILISIDNGNTWQPTAFIKNVNGNGDLINFENSDTFKNANINSVAFGNNLLIAVSDVGYVYISKDTGLTWEQYFDSPNESISFAAGSFLLIKKYYDAFNGFQKNQDVSVLFDPSIYDITFTGKSGQQVNNAIVMNNVYGYRAGLTLGEPWSDEFCAFTINPSASIKNGTKIRINFVDDYLSSFLRNRLYDMSPYDKSEYDSAVANGENEIRNYPPLYHSFGAVLFVNNSVNSYWSKNLQQNDLVVIDKAILDTIQLSISGSSLFFNEIGPVNDVIPLEFRYLNSDLSPVTFPDVATQIDAYLCANNTEKVFTVVQPLGNNNENSNAVLTFDNNFFSTYLKFGTKYSLNFKPNGSFGQRIRVNFKEFLTYSYNLRLFDDIDLSVTDSYNQYDSIKMHDEITSHISEGGAASIDTGYDILPFDALNYNPNSGTVSVLHNIKLVDGNYVYDTTVDTFVPLPILPPSGYPGTVSRMENDGAASTSITEELSIDQHGYYSMPINWVSGNGSVSVPHNLSTPTPLVTIYSTVTNSLVPNTQYIVYFDDNNTINITPKINITGTIYVRTPPKQFEVFYDNLTAPSNGVLVSSVSDEYIIRFNNIATINTVQILNPADMSVISTISPNYYIFPNNPSIKSNNSFSFTLPVGSQLPFLIKIM